MIWIRCLKGVLSTTIPFASTEMRNYLDQFYQTGNYKAMTMSALVMECVRKVLMPVVDNILPGQIGRL